MDQVPEAISEEGTVEELLEEIDREARRRLGMSGEEFAYKYHRGELPDTLAAIELGTLLYCVDRSLIPA